MKTILHLCADIGSDSYIYKKNGWKVMLIGKDIGVENYSPPEDVYGIFANPVCTNFSIAKKGFMFGTDKKQIRNPEDGMLLVHHSIRIMYEAEEKLKKKKKKLAFYVIENPSTSELRKEKYLGCPNMIFQPWQFGDPWTKGTALWGKFNKPDIIHPKWENVPKNDKLYVRPGRPKASLAFLHKSAIHNIPAFKPFIDKVSDDMSFRSLASQGFMQAFYDVNSGSVDMKRKPVQLELF